MLPGSDNPVSGWPYYDYVYENYNILFSKVYH